ncbi:threonine/homoserine/homoserine lactone efflux protein [Rhizobium mesoamericanum]|uniref:LysE family translocator n=1 Tax=Rhizobium mesoamericanum TaxID=1079800 RepID=UPI002788732C|nr:LysE family translocator [Rhizobium mesoamericanum]MDQ0563803.1 threonine/homoserine/homoserine lactone efflux protein [Rhizobium mesoamericanum]
MDLTTILAFVAVTTLLVISPGPNGVLIAKTVPASGRLAGFANVAGFVSAFYLHGAFVVFGVSVILARSAELFFTVKMLGAAYLCWVGIKALMQTRRNPKVAMFYLAAFPQFVPMEQATATNIFLLVFIHSMINLIWFSAIVVVFSRLATLTRGGRVQRWIKAATGVVFVGFGLKLATMRA